MARPHHLSPQQQPSGQALPWRSRREWCPPHEELPPGPFAARDSGCCPVDQRVQRPMPRGHRELPDLAARHHREPPAHARHHAPSRDDPADRGDLRGRLTDHPRLKEARRPQGKGPPARNPRTPQLPHLDLEEGRHLERLLLPPYPPNPNPRPDHLRACKIETVMHPSSRTLMSLHINSCRILYWIAPSTTYQRKAWGPHIRPESSQPSSRSQALLRK